MLQADHRTIMHQARRAVLRQVVTKDAKKQPMAGSVKRHTATTELVEFLNTATVWPDDMDEDEQTAVFFPVAMALVQQAYDVLAASGVDFAKVAAEAEETD